MSTRTEKHLCRYCQYPLVETDKNGNLTYGSHAKGCPAKLSPDKPKSGRDAAIDRLACGDYCKGRNGYVSDLGGISICQKCPHSDLVREGVDTQYKGKKKKPAEIVYKPLSRIEATSRIFNRFKKRYSKK